MPECSDAERKFLDNAARADVVFLLADGGFNQGDSGPSTLAWMKNLTGRPPASFEIDYGHLPPEGDDKWGERVVRRISLKLGITAKQFEEAVGRAGASLTKPDPTDGAPA